MSAPLPTLHSCGACAADTSSALLLPSQAWQGMHASLKQWGRSACLASARLQGAESCDAGGFAHISTSHPEVFEEQPTLDLDGTLHFSIRNERQLYLTCYTTCVGVNVTWWSRRGRW